MTNKTSGSFSRRAFIGLASLGLGSLVAPNAAHANTFSDHNPFANIHVTQVDKRTWRVFNSKTGEAAIGTRNEDGSQLFITHSDNTTSLVTYHENGAIFINDQVFASASNTKGPETRAVPSGYVLFLTRRTHVSAYRNAYDAILALIGIIPVVGGIIQALEALFHDHSLDNAYLEIKQYHHKTTYYIYTVVKFYKYSNYTGLLATREYGPSSPV